jgi:adenosylcobinamide-GDP ribazoletransferase
MRIHSETYVLIAALPFLSKSLMGAMLVTVISAKKEGLGYLFQRAATGKNLWIYPIYVLAFLLITKLLGIAFISIVVITLTAMVCYVFCRRNARKWFGGITGDVLGASVEGTELILWMTVWLLHYFVMG